MAYNQRTTFKGQLDFQNKVLNKRQSAFKPDSLSDKIELALEVDKETIDITRPFETKFEATDMRQLALVAHNHMKPAMKDFIETYSEILKKFRITGTQTTMRMCKAMWGEDNPDVTYGLTCTSGPLGGDAQIAALMCVEDLGALIFFVDPLSAHPHQADIDSLIRLTNCGNVIVCSNPTSAMSMMHTLKCALVKGSRGMIPSFFETLESPAVEEYKQAQNLALQSAINSGAKKQVIEDTDDPLLHSAEDESLVQEDDRVTSISDSLTEDMGVNKRVMFADIKEPPKKTKPSRGLLGFKSYKITKKVGKSVRNLMGSLHE